MVAWKDFDFSESSSADGGLVVRFNSWWFRVNIGFNLIIGDIASELEEE